ncbi:hypothetical protein SBC1_37100 (plasmid) [Caballeronia sp. SBC1]|uniref:hypothetical protein n=1 Tax=unclassified Caballeronia TaxID=2646786 RepID=UPI0013E1C7A2|nr:MULTISPECIES: hypothetical protein [unclassified Caballeronia]QIE27014.1 hypothetical protein SBC2_50840 [Caballeronia sp. SBC2]QIN63670.1 hypothetical protein SBC1_37100 [Caballeronia sp. SBC1]
MASDAIMDEKQESVPGVGEPARMVAFPCEPLRSPNITNRTERLGAMHGTRLSFVRSLVRRMAHDNWRVRVTSMDLDDNGFGVCVYTIEAYGERYSQVIFSQYLDDSERTDRVIAQKWDITSALICGVPNAADIDYLRGNVPLQEAGRLRANDLVLCRANKSVRNFGYVADCLAAGRQPDPAAFERVGYLIRTTAVYGNGKFGIADYPRLVDSHAFNRGFSAQMCAVFVLRDFSMRLVEHVAARRNPRAAVKLAHSFRRYLGVGNATGLGMAPFLVRHPVQVDQWIRARETALARVLAVELVDRDAFERAMALIARAGRHVAQVYTDHPPEAARNALILDELPRLARELQISYEQKGTFRWSKLLPWADGQLSCATQEILVTVLIELYPHLVDSIECATPVDDALTLDPDMSVGELLGLVERDYGWVMKQPAAQRDDDHFFWYRSAEKEEPRLGVRAEEAGAELEQPLDISRQVLRLHTKLKAEEDGAGTVAEFVAECPEYRAIVRRIQTLASRAYGEIRHNLLAHDMLPIDLMRAKLSMFGASKFDPKSNLWVRVTLYQGAPTLDDLSPDMVDDWAFPCVPGGNERGGA